MSRAEVEFSVRTQAFQRGLDQIRSQAGSLVNDLRRKFTGSGLGNAFLTGLGIGSIQQASQTLADIWGKFTGITQDAVDELRRVAGVMREINTLQDERLLSKLTDTGKLEVFRERLADNEQAAERAQGNLSKTTDLLKERLELLNKIDALEAKVGAADEADRQARLKASLDEINRYWQQIADNKKEAASVNERAAQLGREQEEFQFSQLSNEEKRITLQRRLNELVEQQKQISGDDNEAFAERLDYERSILDTRKQLAQIDGDGSRLALSRANIAADSLARVGGGGNIGPGNTLVDETRKQTAILQKIDDRIARGGTSALTLN